MDPQSAHEEAPKGDGEVPAPSIRPRLAKRLMSVLETDDGSSHEPRPLFSEMEELAQEDDQMEWRETARWIKFEENVEDGGNRWSKPHVASLSLHSVFELKNLIRRGVVILDLDALRFDDIVEQIVDSVVKNGDLMNNKRDMLKRVLLKKHSHQHQRKNYLWKGSRGSPDSANGRLIEYSNETNGDFHSKEGRKKTKKKDELISDKHHANAQIVKTEDSTKPNMDFMRKIPHGAEASSVLTGNLDFIDKPICVFVRLKTGVHLNNLVEVPIKSRFLFILLTPESSIYNNHEISRAMGVLMIDAIFKEVAYKARNPNHISVGIDEFLNSLTGLPPGEWDPKIRIEPPQSIPSQEPRKHFIDEPLEELDEEELAQREREESGLARSGTLFGGLVNDIKRKAPFYLSDFKDGLSMQCIASWIFLYFACLSPIITFGGLLAHATGNNMAAMESLVSGFVCGIGFGLFSGQPLAILGSTGPVLVFEKIVYNLCLSNEWHYLSFRFWIGTWICVILVVLVAIDASAYVCYITRFTEENFAILIAFIFIVEAAQNVYHIAQEFPINPPLLENCSCFLNTTDGDDVRGLNKTTCLSQNGTYTNNSQCQDLEYHPNVFLMSVLLLIGTFLISWYLKKFKSALFFSSSVRQFLSDFAVLIAIFSMTLLDYQSGVATPKLQVPTELKPTLKDRGWVVPPFNGNPLYTILLAVFPAMLGTILIFMDQQITAVIVNRREHKLKKKCGYHLDLFVLAVLIQICSLMGIPWFVAATVLSINHVNSLKKESECSAPGEKPQFLGVREQRITHVMIFVTIGLSVFLTPVLGHIPMPVLFGVFLYMGLASLDGLQFWNRILLMFMPKKYQPDYSYLRQVPLGRVHLFTIVQLACLASLWAIKSFSATSILFPLMLIVMVGIRKCLDFIFTQRELKSLDSSMPKRRRSVIREKLTWSSKISHFILGPKLVLNGDKEGADVALNQTKALDC